MSRSGTASCLLTAALIALAAALLVSPQIAQAQTPRKVLLYTGSMAFRHADAITQGAPVLKSALEAQGFTVDWKDCNGNGCYSPDNNPAIFTTANLAQYDVIFFSNASGAQNFTSSERQAIIDFVQHGGGIGANHGSTDMGAASVTWDWWDGSPNSVVGTTLSIHAATDITNKATVQVADHNHLATRDLPDTYQFGDEHYAFKRNVRGTHHVLATLDETTYTTGTATMGQDHPITWCKRYDGASVQDGTPTPKRYTDGRAWVTAMGHFGAAYTENGGDNYLVKQILGGIRWLAGEGNNSDCSGTVWSSYTREVLVSNTNGAIAVDVAGDGKVYWSEIGSNVDGSYPAYNLTGYVRVHDPKGPPNNNTIVASIPVRSDYAASEDGVLGMSLEPGFDLTDPDKRDLYVYYSPRADFPTTGNVAVVGYNQISRFTLNDLGTAVVAGSERVILRVPKVKIAGNPPVFAGGLASSTPGHVGGAGLDFDAEGNLVLGVGDDIPPAGGGHNAYPPMESRASERGDARKTSANTGDLRGKILRIKPLDEIPAGTTPGVGGTYSTPAGNMFAGDDDARTRPEIFAMGFRQPFTVHADPTKPNTIGVGEYCHDNAANQADRGPAGTCEWNLIDKPAFFGWPFCVGDNSPARTTTRWDYTTNSSTGSKYDCSLSSMPSDIRYDPPGGGNDSSEPTNDGLAEIPGPAAPATIWKSLTNEQPEAVFGDLGDGGMQPVSGPIYRWNGKPAGTGGRFPAYWDGAWLIHNRGADNGFWKEVRLRKDNNKMLRVQNFLPANTFGSPNQGLVIGTEFGPDGALYMTKFPVACCRIALDSGDGEPLVRIKFNVQDKCDEDTQAPSVAHELAGAEIPNHAGSYYNTVKLTLNAADNGCAGIDTTEYRVDSGEWKTYADPVEITTPGAHTIEYRTTDRFYNVSAVGNASLEIVAINDSAAPLTTLQINGAAPQPRYTAQVTLRLDAADPAGAGESSGIKSTEYAINGATPVKLTPGDLPRTLVLGGSGAYTIEYHSVDNAGNAEATKQVAFKIEDGLEQLSCTSSKSDSFGSALNPEWEFLRPVETGWRLQGGRLSIDALGPPPGVPEWAMTGPLATAKNVLLQDAPAHGPWRATTTLDAADLVRFGAPGAGIEAGIVVWESEDPNKFSKFVLSRGSFSDPTFVVKHEHTVNNASTLQADRDVSRPTDVISKILIRVTKTTLDGEVYGEYSVNAGETWKRIGNGSAADFDGPVRIGLLSRRQIDLSSVGFPGQPIAHFEDFSVEETDCDAPVTTATLDPAQPGADGTYTQAAVNVNLSATDPVVDEGGGPQTHEVQATGYEWTKTNLAIKQGDTVKWDFAGTFHNICLDTAAPALPQFTANCDNDEVVATAISGATGGQKQFNQAGTFSFYCAFHMPSMTGKVTVAESDVKKSAGVAFTEYRVTTGETIGEWTRHENAGGDQPFKTAVTVNSIGRHILEYRSTDAADNQEPIKSVAFEITDAQPNPPTGDNNAPTLPFTALPGTNPLEPLTHPKPTAAKLNKLPATTTAKFAKSGLKVTTACEAGFTGRVTISVPKSQARKLGLTKATTLASKAITCGTSNTATATLKVSKKLQRAISKSKKPVSLTVKVTMGAGSMATTSSQTLTLRVAK